MLLPRPLAATLAAALTLPAVTHAAANANANAEADADRERRPRHLANVEVVGQTADRYRADRSTTATRTDTDLRDVPQAVAVVTQEVIRDQAMQGMADVVRYLPGLGMAQGEGNRDTPILRGSSSTADLFVDGLRDDVQYYRDLYNIERVEALKGPNAMIFGRGGSGGVLNRVSKVADGVRRRELDLLVAAWNRQRATADVSDAIGPDSAFRVTAMRERADSFRDDVRADRWGLNPTLTWDAGDATTLTFGAEHTHDARTADRGVPSWQGRPVATDRSTFFGDPDRSPTESDVDALTALVEHEFAGGARLRNRTRLADYDKVYQNVYPGEVAVGGQTVSLSAYRNATQRRNLLNQTDLELHLGGDITHTLLLGAELGRQETDNQRLTGYFADDACTATGNTTFCGVPLGDPRYRGPLQFAPSATDADNRSVASNVAVYAQDQIELSPRWHAVLGLRAESLRVALDNHRSGQHLHASDSLMSPRAGLVFRATPALSLYGSWTRAFVPRSGEQLSSLAANNATLEPEEFRNLELGAKWQARPGLLATAAAYRLTRSNVAVVDPADVSKLLLLAGDSQRVQGVELELSGAITERWRVIGGYAWQDAEITRDLQTSTRASGTIAKGTVLPQVPRHSLSLWNRVDLGERWGAGLGLIRRSAVYTSTTNAVTLPAYTRVDAALYYRASDRTAWQLNVENLSDREYFASANGDNNLAPGAPRTVNLGLHLAF